MKNPVSTKPHTPKFRMSLGLVLWILFLICLLIEGMILYQHLYFNFQRDTAAPPPAGNATKIDFDITAVKKIHDWLEARHNYQIETYELRGQEFGRDNPLADYK